MMNQIKLISILTFTFLSSLCLAKEIIVSQSGSIRTITEAISQANDFDTIIIKPGNYSVGNIFIDKKVTVIGENSPVIDGKGIGEIFTVTSNEVHISGLIIKNSGVSYLEVNAGIKLKEVRNCSVKGNKFINNFFAVYLFLDRKPGNDWFSSGDRPSIPRGAKYFFYRLGLLGYDDRNLARRAPGTREHSRDQTKKNRECARGGGIH